MDFITSKAQTIKGLNIALIVLSIIGILGALATFALSGIIGASAYSELAELPSQGAGLPYLLTTGNSLVYDPDFYMDDLYAPAAGIAFVVALVCIFLVCVVISCIVTLIGSIMALRNAGNPNKLKGAFIMSIISAVLAFFTGRIITMVLNIISCVYISKVRAFAGASFAGAPFAAAGAAPVNPTAQQAPTTPPAAGPQYPGTPQQ